MDQNLNKKINRKEKLISIFKENKIKIYSSFTIIILLFAALFTYSPEDPYFIFPDNTEIKNILGFQGSYVSDLFFQSIGLISYLVALTLIITGVNILRIKEFFLIIENLFFTTIYILLGTLFLTHFYLDAFVLYINGNGGFIGSYLNQTFLNSLILINETISYYLLIVIITILFLISINFHPAKFFKAVGNALQILNKKKEKND